MSVEVKAEVVLHKLYVHEGESIQLYLAQADCSYAPIVVKVERGIPVVLVPDEHKDRVKIVR